MDPPEVPSGPPRSRAAFCFNLAVRFNNIAALTGREGLSRKPGVARLRMG